MIERQREREGGRQEERESVLKIGRQIYIVLTCEQFGLNTFCRKGKHWLTVSHKGYFINIITLVKPTPVLNVFDFDSINAIILTLTENCLCDNELECKQKI